MAIYTAEQAAPATPSSGNVVAYAKTDGLLYAKDDAGTEYLISETLTLGTPAATTSGTSHDFTVPAGTRRVTINFSGVSTNGTSSPLIQLGDPGIEATGYLCSGSTSSTGSTATNYTTGFGIESVLAANILHGRIVLELLDASTFTWTCMGVIAASNSAATLQTAGSKSLSATLTTVRLTTVNGSDAYDAGKVNITYER